MIESRLVDMTEEPEPEAWAPDPIDSIPDDPYTVYYDDGSRIFHRHTHSTAGILVDFALVHQAHVDGEWCDIAKADCAHSTVHVHVLDKLGNTVDKTEVMPITSEHDVRKGYTHAYDVLLDKMDTHKARWAST